jgi:hypothetical protein
LADIASEAAARQQTHQPKNMVTVHVGNENTANLARSQVTLEELVLGAFPTVE